MKALVGHAVYQAIYCKKLKVKTFEVVRFPALKGGHICW